MKEARFEAVCPVEIGDKVILVDGSRMAAWWELKLTQSAMKE